MTGPDQQLAALRAEIDAIDSQLHDLLMRRTDLAVQVGEVKARVQPLGGTPADGSKFIRPAREALILRGLVARHRGKLPKAVIVRMWREMISALLQVEGPFVVAVQAPKGDTALWDLARDHYGSRVKITPVPANTDVLNAVARGKATVGILPMPRLGERSPWWPHLLARGEAVPHVMGRLPFGDIGNVRDPKAQAMVIGRAPNEPTGDDRSWIALSLKASRSRRAVLAAAKALQPDAHICLDHAGKGQDWLLDVAGFAKEIEADIAAAAAALGAEARVLGSYATPLQAADLADATDH
ncbi:chorismate mutase [Dongia deserti]|uniref:chorismate mutase n=1 Tax=Dongia deserti TaxID=2268030 RepID=UPI000E646C7F|nr:chorismate mutase [Dongia deserti]